MNYPTSPFSPKKQIAPTTPDLEIIELGLKAKIDKHCNDGILTFDEGMVSAGVDLINHDEDALKRICAKIVDQGASIEHYQQAVIAAITASGKTLTNASTDSKEGVFIRNSAYYRNVEKKGELDEVKITAFIAEILIERERYSASGKLTRSYVMRVCFENSDDTKIVEITANELEDKRWLGNYIGTRGKYSGSYKVIRDAILELSPPDGITIEKVYERTGFTVIDGKECYLSSTGAFDYEGYITNVKTDLSGGPFNNCSNLYISSKTKISDGINATLDILSLAPLDISIPILIAPFRGILAGLSRSSCSLYMHGKSGTGKSTSAGFILGFFQKGPNYYQPTASYTSSDAYLSKLAGNTHSVVTVVDDRVEKNGNKKELNRKDEILFRTQANGQTKSTCLAQSQEPRGLIVATGEQPIVGESLAARVLILQFDKDTLDGKALNKCKQTAKDGLFLACSSGFIQWLISKGDAIVERFESRQVELCDEFGFLSSLHHRVPGNIAEFMATFEFFLEYAFDYDVITDEKMVELNTKAKDALIQLARNQQKYLIDGDAEQYIFALKQALASNKYHLLNFDGSTPANPEKYGWVRTGGTNNQWHPQGEQLGFVGKQNMYLFPEEAYAVYQESMFSTFGGAALGMKKIHKELNKAGMLNRRFPRGNTIRKMTNGENKRYVRLNLNLIL